MSCCISALYILLSLYLMASASHFHSYSATDLNIIACSSCILGYFGHLSGLLCLSPYLIYLQDSWTPLMYAARDGHTNIVRELLEAGADTERRDVVCYINHCLFSPHTLYKQNKTYMFCRLKIILSRIIDAFCKS